MAKKKESQEITAAIKQAEALRELETKIGETVVAIFNLKIKTQDLSFASFMVKDSIRFLLEKNPADPGDTMAAILREAVDANDAAKESKANAQVAHYALIDAYRSIGKAAIKAERVAKLLAQTEKE